MKWVQIGTGELPVYKLLNLILQIKDTVWMNLLLIDERESYFKYPVEIKVLKSYLSGNN